MPSTFGTMLIATCATATLLFSQPSHAGPEAAAAGGNDGRCYRLRADGDPRQVETIDQFCRAVRTLNATGKSGITYQALKGEGCGVADTRRYFIAKPAEEWDLHDFADLIRFRMECRRAAGTANPFDPPDEIASELIYEVYGLVGDTVAKAKERKQVQIAAEARARDRQKQADDHVAMLKAQGFRPVTVSDIQLSGRELIGKKVVVRGYVTLFGDNEARIYTHRDDVNGVVLSIESGPIETRRFILENCSRLYRSCRMELKATVAEVNGLLELRLADDERSGE